MAQPIYKVFLCRPTEALYQLSEEERNSLFAKVEESLERVGCKRLVFCDSRWASEQWAWWGAEVYPDIEAVQKHVRFLDELNFYRYMEAMTLLGTETPAS